MRLFNTKGELTTNQIKSGSNYTVHTRVSSTVYIVPFFFYSNWLINLTLRPLADDIINALLLLLYNNKTTVEPPYVLLLTTHCTVVR